MIPIDADHSRVRVATRRDEDDLLELCRSNHAENGIGDFDEDKALMVIRRAFVSARNDPALIGVVGDGRVEGSLMLSVECPWYGNTPFLQCVWNFVYPPFRKSTTNTKDLLAWARRLSQPAPVGLGLPLWMGLVSTQKTEGQLRMYRRHLGEPIGFTFMCEGTV